MGYISQPKIDLIATVVIQHIPHDMAKVAVHFANGHDAQLNGVDADLVDLTLDWPRRRSLTGTSIGLQASLAVVSSA